MSSKPVILLADAETDIKDAYQWYEFKRKGLGENFLLCIEGALSKISREPLLYAIVHKGMRRTLILRFPFGIFYIDGKKHHRASSFTCKS